MVSILFGLKLWSSNCDLLEKAYEQIKLGTFNFIELSPIPGTSMTPFLEFPIPYIIHISPEKYGVNIADEGKKELNSMIFAECISWANHLKARHIIVHPGYGSEKNSELFLTQLNDPRILIENMPKVGLNGEKMIGYTPSQIKLLIKKRFGFCLDINHAIKSAISLRSEFKSTVLDFLKLNPKLIHIADGHLTEEKDEHLNIGEGDYDWDFIMQTIQKSNIKQVTLETPRKNNSLKSDIENLNRLNGILRDYT